MGAVADLIASRKTFESPSNLTQYLQGKLPIDPAVPAAYDAVDAVHSIAVHSGTVSGGDFTLTVTLKNGETFTTAAIAYDANAATIEGAIDTAATAASITDWTNGDITVAGGPLSTTPVTLTFDGASVAGLRHSATTGDGTGLTGGGDLGAITVTTEGQTVRNAWAVLQALGVISDAAPPDQGDETAPTAGANLLRVPPWVVRELAQECAFVDENNAIYQVIVGAVLGYTDSAPLVETARA